MSIDVNKVFKDLQEFIGNYQGEYVPEMPVGISISMSGKMMVKFTTEKVSFVKDIEQAAEVIQDFLHEQLIKTLKE